MNHIYRSIWNESTGTVTAVSEHAKSRGKKNSSGKNAVVSSGFILKSVSVAVALALGSNSHASPTGGVVVAGNASITSTPGNTTIDQTTQNAVLNWQSFDIGATEAVRFVQPNSHAVALNRVLGADPSNILGSLSSNGKVFLVNPNGILFGTNAQVNVGGLVVSTRNITDSDFMAGRYAFNGTSAGSVENRGSIHADGGYVALLGAKVSNEGIIAARLGTVALAAGNAFTLDVAGDGLLNVAVDAGAVNALAGNGGVIQADGGQILMTAGSASSLLQSAVNNTGLIQAQTIENRNGTIKLLGDMQSGTVNVAGTLDASAPNGGDGGFIDTSSALVNVASGTKVTTAAAQGLTGSWLIDPTDYTIASSGGNITGAQLSSDLAGTNIIIQSSSGGSGSAGDVNVNDVVNWSANKLTLNAQNNINIKANLNASATASLALEFGQGAVAANNTSNIVTSGGAVNLPASTTNFTTRQGSNGTVKNYTVMTSLGAQGSTTTADLQGMNGNLALNYALGADIDASTTSGWNAGAGFMPIGGTSCWPCASLTGTIDGLGHTVSALTINRPSRSMTGLFGYGTATAVIRNIGLNGGAITGSSYTGALIGRNAGTVFNSFSTASVTGTGYVGGLVGRNYGTVSDSYATGNVVGSRVGGLVGRNDNSTTISNSHAAGSVTGSQYAGGLVGDSDNTTISNSYATGSVTGGYRHAGGLVGRMSSGSISNSYATGNVSGVGWTGGLVGDGDSVTISNSHATGNVTSTDQRTGGLIGHAYGITLSNSYATGSVIGTSRAGGLFGYMYGGSATNTYALGAVSGTTSIGGLVGHMNYGSVTRSYSVGAVSGSSAVGGLVGGSSFSNVSNSYWNTDTSSQVSSSGGTGRTSLQMQTASNFSGFNFTTTPGATGNAWVMVDVDGSLNNAGGAAGATRPMLASEYSITITNAHQLQLMSMNLAASYTLGRNIDAAATGTAAGVWSGSTFIPVGASSGFTGSLDGLGHTISNLTVNRPAVNRSGLFGTNIGSISNVGIVGGSVTGSGYSGGLAGTNYGTISGSYFTGTVSGSAARVGGLVGVNNGTINNSHTAASVSGSHATGGLVGANFTTISTSYATGNVSGGDETGGLVGVSLNAVTNSYATGSVTSAGGRVGGLVGANVGTVTNDYATGTVAGNQYVGGLVGRNYGTLDTGYSIGAVTGNSNVGGLVGESLGTVSSGFWDTTTSGQATSGGGTGLTTAGLQAILPTGFSAAIWGNVENQTTPYLLSNPGPVLLATDTSQTYYTLILNLFQLQNIGANRVGNYALANNIDASATRNWNDGAGFVPIGDNTVKFTGNFDGLGHVVSNLTINRPMTDDVGMFGSAFGSNVNRIGLVNADVTGRNNVGALFGSTVLGAASHDYATGEVAGQNTVGGLVGYNNTMGLTASYSTSSVTGTNNVGGLMGETNGGRLSAFNYASGNVTASGSNVGGLVGYNGSAFVIADSYATGNVTGAGAVGGLVGYHLNGHIDRSYSAGSVAGASNVGGLIGYTSSGAVTNSYWNSDTSGQSGSAGGSAMTNAQMQLQTNFAGWDFSATWIGYDGHTNPLLRTLMTELTVTLGSTTKTYDASAYSGGNGATYSTTPNGNLLGSTTIGGTSQGATNAGTYTITGSGLYSNQQGYIINYVNGLLTVDKANLTLGGTRLFDGSNTVAGGVLTATGVAGETFTVVGTGDNGNLASKNVQAGSTLASLTGLALGASSNGGVFSNYNVLSTTGSSISIAPAALTLASMDVVKTYDGATTAAGTVTVISGTLFGTDALSGGAFAFTDKNAGVGNRTVTTAGVTVNDGNGGGNYNVSYANNTTSTIDRAVLTATVSATDKIYDGNITAAATLSAFSGLIGTETLNTSNTATFNGKDVAVANLVTVNSIAPSDGTHGGLASNYSLVSGQTAVAHITPQVLTVVNQVASDKVYDGTTTATLHGGSLAGVIAGETVSLGEAGNFATADAGDGIAVTAADSLSGSAAANYTLAQPVGLAANITAAVQADVPPVVVTPPPVDVVPSPVDAAPPQLAVTSTVAYTSAVGHVVSNSQIAPPPTSVAPPLVAPSNGSPAAGPMMTYDLTGLNLTVIGRDAGLPAVQPQDASEDKE